MPFKPATLVCKDSGPESESFLGSICHPSFCVYVCVAQHIYCKPLLLLRTFTASHCCGYSQQQTRSKHVVLCTLQCSMYAALSVAAALVWPAHMHESVLFPVLQDGNTTITAPAAAIQAVRPTAGQAVWPAAAVPCTLQQRQQSPAGPHVPASAAPSGALWPCLLQLWRQQGVQQRRRACRAAQPAVGDGLWLSGGSLMGCL